MRALTVQEAAQELARLLRKPVLFIAPHMPECSECDDPVTEMVKSAPYLAPDEFMQILADEHGIIVCDDEAELERLFSQTVGDDGPTDSNPYHGPGNTFALTIAATGETMNENT